MGAQNLSRQCYNSSVGNIKQIFTLIFFALIFPELATGSTPLFNFFNFAIFLILFFGYGIAVLLVREFVVREKVNFFGLFLIGFAYTILNEGIFAKTLVREVGFPMPQFDHYGYMFGINVSGFLALSLFHSLFSVIFPIVATHFFFPESKNEPWLGKKISFILAVLTILIGTVLFFAPSGQFAAGTLNQYLILVIFMAIFALCGWFLGRNKENVETSISLTQRPFKLGIIWYLYSFFVFPVFIAQPKLPLAVFFIVYGVSIFVFMHLFKKNGVSIESILLFTLGGYIVISLLAIIMSWVFHVVPNPVERTFSGAIIILTFLFIVRKVLRNKGMRLGA